MNSDIKILIVEDEGIVSIDIQNILLKQGYSNLETAFSGEEAIEKTQDWSPRIILMDIGLSGDFDGIEAAKRIKSKNNIPIIFLTGFADDNTLTRAKKTNPVGFIIKPINDKELEETVSKALS